MEEVLPTPSAPASTPVALWSRDAWFALIAAFGILTHLILRYAFAAAPPAPDIPLIVSLILGGAPLLYGLARNALRGEFGSDLLAGLSIGVSAILGEYLAGTIVVLMLSGGNALERYATRRASNVLAALAKRMPRAAHKLTPSGIEDTSLDDLAIGDQLIVLPHEICPIDGTVTEGVGSMDESYLTGEPFLIAKAPGAEVLSGALNGDSALTIAASRLPIDSRYARIMRVMREAESNRPRIRRIADRLGAWYTLVGIAVALAGWALGKDPDRFLAVLVIATPCPLLLAIPVAIMGAISVAASRGIVVRNPGVLERISECRTAIFDKTGTLTYGKPSLTDVHCAPGISRAHALSIVASIERYSKHPLARAIVAAAENESVARLAVTKISEKPGEGLSGVVGDTSIHITGRKAMMVQHPSAVPQLPPPAPGLECILLVDGEYAALLRFNDEPRPESRSFIGHLGPSHRIERIMLVSGDREEAVRYLAATVGITEVRFGQSPEEKVEIVREEAARGGVLFLGDGINDAPAMKAATVGIAFGQNSDITAEAADAVILDASLGKVDELIHIGRRMRTIALQSAVGGMALSMIGMVIAALGYLPPVAGAVAQEIIDVLAVLNALRVALPGKSLRDI